MQCSRSKFLLIRISTLLLCIIYSSCPNIFSGKIKTGEGLFDCEHYLENEKLSNDKYKIFNQDREKYRWNTYIKLH